MVVVFDIDGTVADASRRLHWIQSRPKNWAAFNRDMGSDPEITSVAALARTLYTNNCLVFCTGRSDQYRSVTEQWLAEHDLKHHGVYMRQQRDHREDFVVKRELIERIWQEHGRPDLVFEDRSRNVEMFRSLGLQCLQVAAGDY